MYVPYRSSERALQHVPSTGTDSKGVPPHLSGATQNHGTSDHQPAQRARPPQHHSPAAAAARRLYCIGMPWNVADPSTLRATPMPSHGPAPAACRPP